MTTNFEIGAVYSFTNKSGYTTRLKVTRITDKSIFCQSFCESNGQWLSEHREGINTVKKYTKCTQS